MRNLFKKYLAIAPYQLILSAVLFLSSCELLEVEENFSIKNDNIEIPNLDVSFGASSDFDLSSADGAFVNLIFESNQTFNGGVDIYVSIDSTDNESVLVTTVESVPAEVVLDIEDLRQAFQEIDLESGDTLFFTFQATIQDESYQFNNTALTSGVLCNSMISTAEDTWTGNAVANNGNSFPSTATANNIKITPLDGDNYLISDISAGWFEAIDFQPIQEGIYNDNCNEITWVGTGENVQFNFADPGIEGSWNPQTQTLTVYWYEPDNDFRGESVFTKNE